MGGWALCAIRKFCFVFAPHSLASHYPHLSVVAVPAEGLAASHVVRGQRDAVVKMNTGSGKTVVGLHALRSCLNEQTGPTGPTALAIPGREAWGQSSRSAAKA